MAAFTITTPSTAITLDDEGRGSATFTVANQSGRSLSARAAVTPVAPAVLDWFTIEPPGPVRDLPKDGSETYTVHVTVPSGTEKGPRSFRLDVASVDRPDEEWAHGPVVGFDLSVGAPIPPGYVESIIGALAGAAVGIVLVLVTGMLLWIVSGRPTSALSFGFLPALSGSFVAAAALGGAIGIFVALLLRAIPHPAPSDTSLAYVVAALVLGTALAILPAFLAPEPALAIGLEPVPIIIGLEPVPIIVAQTLNPIVIQPFVTEPPRVIATGVIVCCFVTFPPIATATRPPTARPTTAPPTPTPTPQQSPVTPVLTLPLVLIASVLAAVVARGATRFRVMGHL
jgi:hypothetical protein